MRAILLNIGNTHTQLAMWRGGGPEQVESVATRVFVETFRSIPALASFPELPILAACVVPTAATALREAWPERDCRFLKAEMAPFPDFSRVDTAVLGADRTANAVGALCVMGPPVIVLDAGTATTTEVIDARGLFLGGAIAPGRRMLRKALHLGTGQLPDVPLGADLPGAVGTDTEGAIRAGTDLGFIGMVDCLLATTRRELGVPECPVLVTGGDRRFCVRHIPGLTLAPAHLTLTGLARVAHEVLRN
ncbi:MAG: type III pantothenate kinase [Kiritimatiellaeota bacterium]|nr:type III pantothenate kinase [Kiritimatiellota bacterium]